MGGLTFNELTELLELVYIEALSNLDEDLLPLILKPEIYLKDQWNKIN